MFYRIIINMMFDSPDPMSDILDKCKDHEGEAITINHGQVNEERSFVTTHVCTHDGPSSLECKPDYKWESP